MLEYPGKCRCALPEETCRVRRSFPDNVRREERLDMKSIKSKIQISMLSVVLMSRTGTSSGAVGPESRKMSEAAAS